MHFTKLRFKFGQIAASMFLLFLSMGAEEVSSNSETSESEDLANYPDLKQDMRDMEILAYALRARRSGEIDKARVGFLLLLERDPLNPQFARLLKTLPNQNEAPRRVVFKELKEIKPKRVTKPVPKKEKSTDSPSSKMTIQQSVELHKLLIEAKTRLVNGDYEGALEAYQTIECIFPNTKEAKYYRLILGEKQKEQRMKLDPEYRKRWRQRLQMITQGSRFAMPIVRTTPEEKAESQSSKTSTEEKQP